MYPHLSTWLNQKRWEDEIDLSPPMGESGLSEHDMLMQLRASGQLGGLRDDPTEQEVDESMWGTSDPVEVAKCQKKHWMGLDDKEKNRLRGIHKKTREEMDDEGRFFDARIG